MDNHLDEWINAKGIDEVIESLYADSLKLSAIKSLLRNVLSLVEKFPYDYIPKSEMIKIIKAIANDKTKG